MTPLETLINLFTILGYKIDQIFIGCSHFKNKPEYIEINMTPINDDQIERLKNSVTELGFIQVDIENIDGQGFVSVDCTSVEIFKYIDLKKVQ